MIETEIIEMIVEVPKFQYRDVVEVVPEVRYKEIIEVVPKIVIEDRVRPAPQPAERIDGVANVAEKFERMLLMLEVFECGIRW